MTIPLFFKLLLHEKRKKNKGEKKRKGRFMGQKRLWSSGVRRREPTYQEAAIFDISSPQERRKRMKKKKRAALGHGKRVVGEGRRKKNRERVFRGADKRRSALYGKKRGERFREWIT